MRNLNATIFDAHKARLIDASAPSNGVVMAFSRFPAVFFIRFSPNSQCREAILLGFLPGSLGSLVEKNRLKHLKTPDDNDVDKDTSPDNSAETHQPNLSLFARSPTFFALSTTLAFPRPSFAYFICIRSWRFATSSIATDGFLSKHRNNHLRRPQFQRFHWRFSLIELTKTDARTLTACNVYFPSTTAKNLFG
ncbi:Hypothetical protein NTJ_01665 [Nesidiocoris tenuis]|uniref:Uncharacterized protein n=1 Tax=Nesidiocoris tenuis TaxID=355587 RepID=A0ABN7A968_9HEMI|nr:Hypothetical protein NTJ_01665 [Nesidiocoris tenuis]